LTLKGRNLFSIRDYLKTRRLHYNPLHGLGDLAAARKCFERALAIGEKAYGPDHRMVARDVNNLGSVLRDLGDLRLRGQPSFYLSPRGRNETLKSQAHHGFSIAPRFMAFVPPFGRKQVGGLTTLPLTRCHDIPSST